MERVALTQLRVLIPVYNDWQTVELVLRDLDDVARRSGERFDVTLVNDGSSEVRQWDAALAQSLTQVDSLEIANLYINRGLHFAVAVGLAHIAARRPCEAVLLMDGDGEDRPADVPGLLRAFREDPTRLVVAHRRRRQEGWVFRLSYLVFKQIFWLFTGRHFTFGIFGVCSWGQLQGLVRMPELLSSYPGTLLRSRVPLTRVPTDRGTRLMGKTHFGFVGHLQHGLGAIAVDLDRVLLRLLVFLGAAAALLIALMITIVLIKVTGQLDLPGWASLALGLSAIGLIQIVVLALLLLFISMRTKNQTQLVPALVWQEQIASVDTLWARTRA